MIRPLTLTGRLKLLTVLLILMQLLLLKHRNFQRFWSGWDMLLVKWHRQPIKRHLQKLLLKEKVIKFIFRLWHCLLTICFFRVMPELYWAIQLTLCGLSMPIVLILIIMFLRWQKLMLKKLLVKSLGSCLKTWMF